MFWYTYISIYIYIYVCVVYVHVVCVCCMFRVDLGSFVWIHRLRSRLRRWKTSQLAGKTDEERSTEPGGILQKLMIFSGKSFKNGWFGATKGWYNSKCRIFSNFFNSKCMTWVSLWAILSAWFKYHWGAILSACHHALRILTARRPLHL